MSKAMREIACRQCGKVMKTTNPTRRSCYSCVPANERAVRRARGKFEIKPFRMLFTRPEFAIVK